MSNKLKLQDHITDLRLVLDTINALPEKGTDAYAVIGVTYPEGSTCTCSNGSEMFELDDTVGYGFFLIPSAGEWTVTATDGTNIKSESVSITSKGQFASVKLSYWNGELYTVGNKYEEHTGGFVTAKWTDGSYTGDVTDISTDALLGFKPNTNLTAGGIFTAKMFDLTEWSTITVVFDESSTFDRDGSTGFQVFLVINETLGGTYEGNAGQFAANAEINVKSTSRSLDISAFSGKYYVGAYVFNGWGDVFINDLRLSK